MLRLRHLYLKNKRVCIYLRGVIARNYFYYEEKQISRRIQFFFFLFFVSMGIATNFEVVKLG